MPQYLVVEGSDTHHLQRLPRFCLRARSKDGAALDSVETMTGFNPGMPERAATCGPLSTITTRRTKR